MKDSLLRPGIYNSLASLGVLFGAVALSPVIAHHSVVAHYLVDESVAVSGVVEEFWFENPHARIVVNVTSKSGETERWIVETGARNNMIRAGWNGDEIKPGDRVDASGLPSRDGSNTMELRLLTMEDGRQFRARGGSLRPVEE